MDYPKSDPRVGLHNGKFTDGLADGTIKPSLDTAAHDNAMTDEILNVITAADLIPDEFDHTQLRQAVVKLAALDIPSLGTAAAAADADMLAIALAGGGHRKVSVANLFTSRGGFDQVARDRVALTNLRQIINTAVTSSALIQGRQWELLTDEWAAGSSGYTLVASSPGYYTNRLTELTGTGTISGTMTNAANAFGGANSKPAAQCATGVESGGYEYIGETYAAPVNVTRLELYPSSDAGWLSGGMTANEVWLETYNGTTWTQAWFSAAAIPSINAPAIILSGLNLTGIRGWRWKINLQNGGNNTIVSRVRAYNDNAAAVAMTLVSPVVNLAAAPNYADAYFLWKDDSGGAAVLGTDMTAELSADGSHYVTASLTNVLGLGGFDGTYSVIKARAAVSVNPGTSLTARLKTTSKAQRIAAPAVYGE